MWLLYLYVATASARMAVISESGREKRVVFAEVLGGDEEVVVAGGVEPVADGGPEVAGHERVDEAQPAERARRRNDGHELERSGGCRWPFRCLRAEL